MKELSVVALAGGVGGAKLADGLQNCVGGGLTVIVNTGDDFELYGLHISPDLDTVMYTLASLANPDTGWGVAADTFSFLEMLRRYGQETWFALGDRDLGVHVLRTAWLREGLSLTEVTQKLARSLGVRAAIVPMTDAPVATVLQTDEGELPFQEYFVHRRWEPAIRSVRFAGIESAQLAPGAAEALERADLIVFCPSNPFVSIEPILAVSGTRARLTGVRVPRVAVSPIVRGQALKGPAAKMFRELGVEPSALAVAQRYVGLIDRFVIDRTDEAQAREIEQLGMQVLAADIVMQTPADRLRLAGEIISWAAA